MYASATSQRFLIWASIAGASIFGFGFVVLTGLFPPPSPILTAEQVAVIYTQNNQQLRLGVVTCLVAAAFNASWSVAVAIQMARQEKGTPVWAITQLVAGTLSTLVFTLPPLFWGVAAFSSTRDPQITLLMHELAFLTLVSAVSFFWLQALPMAVVALSKRADPLDGLPRWTGYLSAWLLAIAEVGVLAQLFKTGPFAWNGIFSFWIPLSGFAIWFSAINFTMLRAISRQKVQGLA